VKIHLVKKGDTLYFIAKKYNVSLEELLKANPEITNPDVIDVGMKVKIPASTKPPLEVMHQHTVQQGDTLWKLAKAWGVSLADMIEANPQLKNPNVLLTGEVVNIPKVKSGASGKAHDTAAAQLPAGKKDTSVMPEFVQPAETKPAPAPEESHKTYPHDYGQEQKEQSLFAQYPLPAVEAGAQTEKEYGVPQQVQLPQTEGQQTGKPEHGYGYGYGPGGQTLGEQTGPQQVHYGYGPGGQTLGEQTGPQQVHYGYGPGSQTLGEQTGPQQVHYGYGPGSQTLGEQTGPQQVHYGYGPGGQTLGEQTGPQSYGIGYTHPYAGIENVVGGVFDAHDFSGYGAKNAGYGDITPAQFQPASVSPDMTVPTGPAAKPAAGCSACGGIPQGQWTGPQSAGYPVYVPVTGSWPQTAGAMHHAYGPWSPASTAPAFSGHGYGHHYPAYSEAVLGTSQSPAGKDHCQGSQPQVQGVDWHHGAVSPLAGQSELAPYGYGAAGQQAHYGYPVHTPANPAVAGASWIPYGTYGDPRVGTGEPLPQQQAPLPPVIEPGQPDSTPEDPLSLHQADKPASSKSKKQSASAKSKLPTARKSKSGSRENLPWLK